MKIQIASGIGRGPTTLAAFDAALLNAGIANYNLLPLSSVIPPGSELVLTERATEVGGEWGDRLYIVIAEERVATPNEEAWAGVGWVQDAKTGRGLFVEHHGHSEATVRGDISQSLEALCDGRGVDFGPIQMQVNGVICEREPVCSMVVAVYESQPWASRSGESA